MLTLIIGGALTVIFGDAGYRWLLFGEQRKELREAKAAREFLSTFPDHPLAKWLDLPDEDAYRAMEHDVRWQYLGMAQSVFAPVSLPLRALVEGGVSVVEFLSGVNDHMSSDKKITVDHAKIREEMD